MMSSGQSKMCEWRAGSGKRRAASGAGQHDVRIGRAVQLFQQCDALQSCWVSSRHRCFQERATGYEVGNARLQLALGSMHDKHGLMGPTLCTCPLTGTICPK